MRTLLAGGRVIDPSQGIDRPADLLIVNGKVEAVLQPGEDAASDERLDVTGLTVCPGFIDIHVHLREPGFEYKEDIESGSAAAAAGGFTRICCMPNTNPAIDTASVCRHIIERAAGVGKAHVHPIGAATRGMEGERLTEINDLKSAGAVAISDDAFPIQNARTMRSVMQYCAMLNMPLMTHNEEKELTTGGSMNEGAAATVLGLAGMPPAAEDIAVARNIMLAAITGCRLHLLHISTAGTVELLRNAKEKGLAVTGEACPHHWALTDEACLGFNTDAKMNPPLRTTEDCEAIMRGLADGTIDCISTDHAPHAPHEKEVEFDAAPFGILGLETAVGLAITHLVAPGRMTLSTLVARFTTEPSRILGLSAGTLRPGAAADITVLDTQAAWQVDRAAVRSRSSNTPFHGATLKGRAAFTMVNGVRIAPEPAT
ncbi:MAG: dihydroorotase [Armatimonadetes bacterium]|nr:dihydroorotase [Armatimonadota bacterium]MDE2205556.1 dihydroorotase [Armatimonadota bacterium]